jgi:predicted KAP-like P-loop ATPase
MERPISDKRQDELDRAPFVRRIADGLVDSKTSRATEVTVGLDGPWGSGKTSILNLLQEEIEARHPKALVVRFDPWLVAGREDLIVEFFNEIARTLKHSSRYKNRAKALVDELMNYSEYVAPIASLVEPVSGTTMAAASRIWKKFWGRNKKPIGKVRSDLVVELRKSQVPIIVLIDELDRIEDSDVRTMAQLVRAIANLPSISYVLAYDSTRVAQALGGSNQPEEIKRGRAYLEKIVNIEVPVPIATPEEIMDRIVIGLRAKNELLQLPNYFSDDARFQELLSILTPDIINTARDTTKLLAMYEFMANAIRHEVDWVDLIAFCALRVKSPSLAEKLKQTPFLFTDYVESPDVLRTMDWRKKSPELRLTELIAPHEASRGSERLLSFMFPYLSQYSNSQARNSDSIYYARPLYSALRLSIPPGSIAKLELLKLLKKSADEIADQMYIHNKSPHIDRISDRVAEIYQDLEDIQRNSYWKAATIVVEKSGKFWPKSEHEIYRPGRHLSDVLFSINRRNEGLGDHCRDIFFAQAKLNENVLAAHLLRQHIHWHGIFNRSDAEISSEAFLTKEEAEDLAISLSKKWRESHINGQLFPRHWDLVAVYTMIDTGIWDTKCRDLTTELIQEEEPAIGLLLSLYGSHYYTESQTVEKIVDKKSLNEMASKVLGAPPVSPGIKLAARKCLRNEP